MLFSEYNVTSFYFLSMVVCIMICESNTESTENGEIDLKKTVSEIKTKLQEVTDQQSTLANENVHLKTELEELRQIGRVRRSAGSAGTTYIRWGRTSCGPYGAQTLYRGNAAGAHHAKGGGGSNHLCLHEYPQWLKSGNFHSHIYGIEYEVFNDGSVFLLHNNGGNKLWNYPSPCAACYVPTRSAVIMIPARIACPSGWTKEYQGYIMAQMTTNSRHRNEYTCWDLAPESSRGGTVQDQSLIYPVQVGCGSLPCSMQAARKALTCVVCTK